MLSGQWLGDPDGHRRVAAWKKKAGQDHLADGDATMTPKLIAGVSAAFLGVAYLVCHVVDEIGSREEEVNFWTGFPRDVAYWGHVVESHGRLDLRWGGGYRPDHGYKIGAFLAVSRNPIEKHGLLTYSRFEKRWRINWFDFRHAFQPRDKRSWLWEMDKAPSEFYSSQELAELGLRKLVDWENNYLEECREWEKEWGARILLAFLGRV